MLLQYQQDSEREERASAREDRARAREQETEMERLRLTTVVREAELQQERYKLDLIQEASAHKVARDEAIAAVKLHTTPQPVAAAVSNFGPALQEVKPRPSQLADEIDPGELAKQQQEDPTLQELLSKVRPVEEIISAAHGYFLQEGEMVASRK
ncbi:hypothetical protein NQZ68_007231 [Dissostichus eleginoides]|nr:hypothetical protein NQZ68_007231 [Dissostichus eleginoides]